MKPTISPQLHTSQKQVQKISARQLQSINILQMDRQTLLDRIQTEFEQNPLLDYVPVSSDTRGDSGSSGNSDGSGPGSSSSTSYDSYDNLYNGTAGSGYGSGAGSDNDDDGAADFTSYTAARPSFLDSLESQLYLLGLPDRRLKLCRLLLGMLDENGRLSCEIDTISSFSGIPKEDLEEALRDIQSLEPAGIGARSLEECLELQLKAQDRLTPLLRRMIEECMPLIARHEEAAAAERLGITVQEAEECAEIIRGLDPLPGNTLASNEPVSYIVPDLRADADGRGGITVEFLKENYPRAFLNPQYVKMLKNAEPGSETAEYLTRRYNAAQQFLNDIVQRQETILSIARAIADRQSDFFLRDPSELKPLTQAEIAEACGISISTVSRTVNGKYISCRFGVFELKDFFASGMKKQDGTAVSSHAILLEIRNLIQGESKTSPLSDQRIADLLSDRGIPIARRTVAKYRTQANIPSTAKRRRR